MYTIIITNNFFYAHSNKFMIKIIFGHLQHRLITALASILVFKNDYTFVL